MAVAGSDQAAGWMMLDRFVYRRDEDHGGGGWRFPDESTAPLRATSSTSLGRPFEVAILHAEPPAVSRLYVRWPGGTKGKYGSGTVLMAAHRDFILFQLVSMAGDITHDHFVCIACSDPAAGPHMELKRLPLCTIPMVVLPPCCEEDTEGTSSCEEDTEGTSSCEEDSEGTTMQRVFFPNTVGLIRGSSPGHEEEFAVAQLGMVTQIRGAYQMEAEVCVLRSCVSAPDDAGMWEVQKIPIQHKTYEFPALDNWLTDAVITFNKYICWISYYTGGILFYDIFAETPNIFYLPLPTANRPRKMQERGFLEMNRSLCVTGVGGDLLKYTSVVRHDEKLCGPLEPRTGYTIVTDTLSITESGDINCFHERVKIAFELWHYNTSECLPREGLMYPLVSMDNPSIVHYLISGEGDKIDKVSMVALDMITQKATSIVPYIKGEEDLCGQDADMVKEKSHLLTSFLPSEFPKFLNLTRDR
ncbi:hypothetical protein VPH35_049812 [Triticum aestivum]|uniref:uncharacterized protein n=1 Tax=Triticum aestivum TaxID=4565 RepID=UPI0008425FE7|nr:uncharacterized protein LOC123064795 [Triticum aestivum]